MIVIADSSPLIALCRIGRLDLLNVLFGKLLIPDAVWNELTGGKALEVLIEAHRQGIVTHPAAIAQDLRDVAGFWVSDELMEQLR